uniref:tRNA pseudouridine(13) synthase TruD n=1 Tax=Ignisphaera aggregans TaxID=334771 RepID=A0A7C2VPT1_9CREN
MDTSFLNFFGYQRFGTRKPVTHLIGKLLLKKEWPLLVDLMCRLRSGRASETPEGKVCSMWLRYNDYVKAVKSLPKEYLILYINAYQSYIFNVTLSMLWTRLVERYGVEKAFSYLEDRFAYIPVPGLRTPLVQEEIREIVDEVLEIEGIDQEDFRIEPLGLAVRGDTRRSLSRAYDVKIWFGDREMNLSFVLDRGCYATVFVRELLRTNPLRYT